MFLFRRGCLAKLITLLFFIAIIYIFVIKPVLPKTETAEAVMKMLNI